MPLVAGFCLSLTPISAHLLVIKDLGYPTGMRTSLNNIAIESVNWNAGHGLLICSDRLLPLLVAERIYLDKEESDSLDSRYRANSVGSGTEGFSAVVDMINGTVN